MAAQTLTAGRIEWPAGKNIGTVFIHRIISGLLGEFGAFWVVPYSSFRDPKAVRDKNKSLIKFQQHAGRVPIGVYGMRPSSVSIFRTAVSAASDSGGGLCSASSRRV